MNPTILSRFFPFRQSQIDDGCQENDKEGKGKCRNVQFKIEAFGGMGNELKDPGGEMGVDGGDRGKERKGKERKGEGKKGGEDQVVNQAEQREALEGVENEREGGALDR